MTAFLAAAVALLAGCATALPPPSKLPFADLPYVQGSGCINCVPSVYNLETAGKYCARMDAIAVVKVPPRRSL